jgi:tRNA(Ile)-lysidine synthase
MTQLQIKNDETALSSHILRLEINMINKVKNNINNSNLLNNQDRVLLGLSGGVDSMVLFDIMRQMLKANMFKELTIAHIDHMLRDKESDRDRELVIQTCKIHNIKCFTHQVDIKKECTEKKISTEMAAREARYNFFEKCCKDNNLNCIVTAHNADDQAETVLLRLIRGTTLTGITGIKTCSDYNGLKLIRPMLGCTREEIEQYAKDNQIIWREDASNSTDDYLRNKIRHHITPFITNELNPAFVRNISKMTRQFQIDDDFIEKQADDIKQKALQGDCLDFNKISAIDLALQNRVIREWLTMHIPPTQLDNQTINKIHQLHKSEKATCHLEIQNNFIIHKSYNVFSIKEKNNKQVDSLSFELGNENEITFGSYNLHIAIKKAEGIIFDDTNAIGELPAKASLQIPAGATIVVRNLQPGDRMEPLGISGSKKLKDIFINAKVPLEKRQLIPIIEIDGVIAWIPGYRISKHFKVTEPTKQCTHILIESD